MNYIKKKKLWSEWSDRSTRFITYFKKSKVNSEYLEEARFVLKYYRERLGIVKNRKIKQRYNKIREIYEKRNKLEFLELILPEYQKSLENFNIDQPKVLDISRFCIKGE